MSVESPAVRSDEYIVAKYIWHEPDRRSPAFWFLGFPEHFTELVNARAYQKKLFNRAVRPRIGTSALWQIRWHETDDTVWKMQHIANPADYHDAPNYNDTSPPRGGYVVIRDNGDWDKSEAFCECYLQLGEAQAYIVHMQIEHPDESFLIYEMTSVDTPAEISQTVFAIGQYIDRYGGVVDFTYGHRATLAEARAAAADLSGTNPWVIYEARLVEIVHNNKI